MYLDWEVNFFSNVKEMDHGMEDHGNRVDSHTLNNTMRYSPVEKIFHGDLKWIGILQDPFTGVP